MEMPIVRHDNELVLHLFKQITAFINKTHTQNVQKKRYALEELSFHTSPFNVLQEKLQHKNKRQ